MRPTLHDYVIKRFETILRIEHFATAFRQCYDFSKLTNRAPRLGDFVPCDEEGNVLEEPECDCLTALDKERCGQWDKKHPCMEYQQELDRVIFAGDWEVDNSGLVTTISEHELRIKLSFDDVYTWVTCWNKSGDITIDEIVNRIEELPREIEFKEGVI